MRILSLDIDRFGCFEDKHLNFKKGLNIVNGPDGSGKTGAGPDIISRYDRQ